MSASSSFRVYDLRHTFASLLLAQGVPITYVSAQLGHSRPTTTLQVSWAQIWHQKQIAHSQYFGSARFNWWAVEDSNLRSAD